MPSSLALTTLYVQYRHVCYNAIHIFVPGKPSDLQNHAFLKKRKKEIGLKGKTGLGPDHSKLRELWDQSPKGNQSAQLKITTDICILHHRPLFAAFKPRGLCFPFRRSFEEFIPNTKQLDQN